MFKICEANFKINAANQTIGLIVIIILSPNIITTDIIANDVAITDVNLISISEGKASGRSVPRSVAPTNANATKNVATPSLANALAGCVVSNLHICVNLIKFSCLEVVELWIHTYITYINKPQAAPTNWKIT